MFQPRNAFFKAGTKPLQQINLFTVTRETMLFENVCLASEGNSDCLVEMQGGEKATFFYEVHITRNTITYFLS